MTRPNRTLWVYLWASLVACAAAPLSAADVQIAAVQFPDNKTVDLPLGRQRPRRARPGRGGSALSQRAGRGRDLVQEASPGAALRRRRDLLRRLGRGPRRHDREPRRAHRPQPVRQRPVPHGPEGIRHPHHGRAVPAGLKALRSHHLHLHRSAAQEGQQHSGDALGLPAGAQLGNPTIGSMVYSGKESLDLDPGPERSAAGDRDARREVRAGRDARRRTSRSRRPRTPSSDGQNKQGVDYARRSVAQSSAAIRDDAAEGSRGRRRRGRRHARGRRCSPSSSSGPPRSSRRPTPSRPRSPRGSRPWPRASRRPPPSSR